MKNGKLARNFTYGIFYPEDYSDPMKAGTMFYAGKGSGIRMKTTIRVYSSQRQNRHKMSILNKIRSENREPIVKELAVFDCEQDAYMHEMALIFLMPQLCNLTMGGKGGMLNPSVETRAKLSIQRRGKKPALGVKHTVQARENMSLSHRGKQQSPAWIEKRIAPHRGRKRLDTSIRQKGSTRIHVAQRKKAKGYYFHKSTGTWHARIDIGGKTISLGYFVIEQDAHNAYMAYRQKALNM